MTRREFIKELADRVELDEKIVKAIFEAHEDLVMEIIATEDEIKFSWGRIFGKFREPRKVYGRYAKKPGVLARGGWSLAKSGVPGIEWSKEAKEYTPVDPTELYCEWQEAKYTTKAREYRKERKLPEIREFIGLPEERIQEICKKADEKRYGKKTKKQIIQEAKIRQQKIKIAEALRDIQRHQFIEEKVAQGANREKLEKLPISVILEEKRKEWQKTVEQVEKDSKKIKVGQLDPYEFLREDSMAEYYTKLLNDQDELEPELEEALQSGLEGLLDELDFEDEEEDEIEANQKPVYDIYGYRIDDDGNRIPYWKL